MTERTQVILFFSIATFVIVVFIALLLLRRHGARIESAQIRQDIEGMRQQMSVEHQALQEDVRTTKGWLSRLLDRFSFLRSPPP